MRDIRKVLFILFLFAGIVYSDISVASYSVVPTTIRPGTNGALVLNLENDASYEARALRLDSTGTGYVYSNEGISIGELNPGGSTVISIPFQIQEDAPAGIYTLRATIRGTYDDPTLSSDERDIYRTIEVPIIVENPAQFTITSDTTSVTTGDDFYITVTLKNSGGIARNTELALSSVSTIYLLDEDPKYIGAIEDEVNLTLHMSISASTESGKNRIPINISYVDNLGQSLSSIVYLTLNVNKQAPEFQISIDEVDLTSGERKDLSIYVTNTGNMGAHNLRLSMGNNSALISIGDSQISLGDLAVGETKTETFRVGVSEVQPEFYQIPFTINYEDSNGEDQTAESINVGIEITPLISFASFIDSKPTPLTAGQIHTLSVQVSNTGSSSVKSLTVSINGEAFTVIDAQNEQFIGSLDSDDFSTLQFKVKVGDVPDGVYPLNVSLTYKDPYNQEKEFTDTVNVQVFSAISAAQFSEETSDYTICIIGIILLIIVVIVVWYYKFRPKKKA